MSGFTSDQTNTWGQRTTGLGVTWADDALATLEKTVKYPEYSISGRWIPTVTNVISDSVTYPGMPISPHFGT